MTSEVNCTQEIGYRCLIQGKLTTRSFLHIGSGEFTPAKEEPRHGSNGTAKPDDDSIDQDGTSPENIDGSGTNKKQGRTSLVVTGHNGQAIIPASALRGAIRSRLRQLNSELADSLMGFAAEEEDADSDENSGRARRLFIQTATIVDLLTDSTNFDVPLKRTDHIAMTAISRWRRAPQDKMLRTVEAVPPGVTFSVSIGICGDFSDRESGGKPIYKQVTAADVSAVLTALGHFDSCPEMQEKEAEKASGESRFSPLQLGAFQKSGWGVVEWSDCKISVLTKNGLEAWLESPQSEEMGEQGWGLCAEEVDPKLVQRYAPQHSAPAVIHLPLTLQFNSTFLTQDQRDHIKRAIASAAMNNNLEPSKDVAKVMRIDGRAWLSGQSLKGALRSQFERILRTRGIPCCDPTLEPDREGIGISRDGASLTRERCKPIHSAAEVGNLCPACQIFGAGGWASTIEISAFVENEPGKDTRREFLAISRFTGGGVPGLKFSSEVALQPVLSGSISINWKRLAFAPSDEELKKLDEEKRCQPEPLEVKLAALLHLFRDFVEGDIPVGSGRSRGFGAFTVKLRGTLERHNRLNGTVTEPTISSPNDKSIIESGDELKTFACAVRSLIAGNNKHKSALDCFSEDDDLKQSVTCWLDKFDAHWPRIHSSAPETRSSVPDWWSVPAHLNPPASIPAQVHTTLDGRYNPYHWVPAVKPEEALCEKVRNFGSSPEQRHDNYGPEGISGELCIRVKLHTPVFVGGRKIVEAREGSAALVSPYCVGGTPAIPSTSLRGLVSSVFEIATASSMRVLDAEKIYSYRMEAKSDVTFNMIGRVMDENYIEPWCQRPMNAHYDPVQHIPQNLRNLPFWEVVRKDQLTNERVPNYYRLDDGIRQMPDTRDYEIRLMQPLRQFAPVLIPEGTREQFYRLADECTDPEETSPRPYQPIGQSRGGRENTCRLKAGQFVYFRVDPSGQKVTRVALSQIWRDDIKVSIGEKFGGGELMPFTSKRGLVTPAELVFGFVNGEEKKERKLDTQHDRELEAFASKLIISDALLTSIEGGAGSPYLRDIPETLKIMGTPKPPSPALYFEPSGHLCPDALKKVEGRPGRLSSIQEISSQMGPKPRGRKMYLHLDPGVLQAGDHPWVSKRQDNMKQKVQIRCLNPTCRFEFKIGFDNLTPDEFLALCYSLRPKPAYQHKLGMGKPLGLGSISFHAVSVGKVDRITRYTTAGFGLTRFKDMHGNDDWIDARAQEWRQKVKAKQNQAWENALQGLEVIGTSKARELQYPMTRRQTDLEDKLYEWHSLNRRLGSKGRNGKEFAQFLRPICTSISPLPLPIYVMALFRGCAVPANDINELRRDAKGFHQATTADEAARKIEEWPDYSIVFLLTNLDHRVNYHGRDVRRFKISCDRDGRIDRVSRAILDDVIKALSLGAK